MRGECDVSRRACACAQRRGTRRARDAGSPSDVPPPLILVLPSPPPPLPSPHLCARSPSVSVRGWCRCPAAASTPRQCAGTDSATRGVAGSTASWATGTSPTSWSRRRWRACHPPAPAWWWRAAGATLRPLQCVRVHVCAGVRACACVLRACFCGHALVCLCVVCLCACVWCVALCRWW